MKWLRYVLALPFALALVGATYPIQHIVVVVMENRTVDNLFQFLPGANTVSNCIVKEGHSEALTSQSFIGKTYPSHTHQEFLGDLYQAWVNGGSSGPLNGAMPNNQGWSGAVCTYVPQSEAQPYYTLAQQYVFGDMFFQTNQGPSMPAHMWLDSGTSACTGGMTQYNGTPVPQCTSPTKYMVSDNPGFGHSISGLAGQGQGGCPSVTSGYYGPAQVNLVSPTDTTSYSTYYVFPCFLNPSIFYRMHQAGRGWRLYEASYYGYGYWEPGAWDYNLFCLPGTPGPSCGTPFTCGVTNGIPNVCHSGGTGYTANKNNTLDADPTCTPIPQCDNDDEGSFVNDVGTCGKLANLTYITPTDAESDHAGAQADGWGPSYVTNIVNAVGQSCFWSSTEIIVTWDDWGGWFDHVCPGDLYAPGANNDAFHYSTSTQCGTPTTTYTPGYRVPLLFISPYAVQHHISNNVYDFCSILLHVEKIFSLASLNTCDRTANDFTSEFSNYSKPPHAFKVLASAVPSFLFATLNAMAPDLSGPPDQGPDDRCDNCFAVPQTSKPARQRRSRL